MVISSKKHPLTTKDNAMSLETALQETTTAINALVHLLTARTGATMSASEYIASLDAPTLVAPQVDITAAPVEQAKFIETLDPTTGKITKRTPEEYAALCAKNAAAVQAHVEPTVAVPVEVKKEKPAPVAAVEPAAPLDYSKDVKPLLLDLSKSKGRDALAELLAKFDATNGTQIAATAYADVIARVQSLLAA